MSPLPRLVSTRGGPLRFLRSPAAAVLGCPRSLWSSPAAAGGLRLPVVSGPRPTWGEAVGCRPWHKVRLALLHQVNNDVQHGLLGVIAGEKTGGPKGCQWLAASTRLASPHPRVAGVRLRVGGRPRWLLPSCCVRLWCCVCRTVRPAVAGCCGGGVVGRAPRVASTLGGCLVAAGLWVVWACLAAA